MRVKNEPTVFVVDDDEAIRSAIRFLMRTAKLNVETYEGAERFLAEYDPRWPGCLVLDVRMPGMSGLALQKVLRERAMEIPVIIITGHGDIPMAVEAMKAGAADFIEKPFKNDELLQKVRQCIAHDERARRSVNDANELSERLHSLTPREKEVMELLVQGKRNKLIAAELGISSRTVEAHRSRVMEKLQAESLSDIVKIAIAAHPQEP